MNHNFGTNSLPGGTDDQHLSSWHCWHFLDKNKQSLKHCIAESWTDWDVLKQGFYPIDDNDGQVRLVCIVKCRNQFAGSGIISHSE